MVTRPASRRIWFFGTAALSLAVALTLQGSAHAVVFNILGPLVAQAQDPIVEPEVVVDPIPDPPPVNEEEIPPIFEWKDPPVGEAGQPGDPPGNPPGEINGVPEPATLVATLIGLAVAGAVGYRRRSKRA